MLRKAFHNEKISYSRKGNDEFWEIDQPKLSVVLSGTPKQLLRLIPSAEDGLFSRFAFYGFSVEQHWEDVRPRRNALKKEEYFQNLSEEVKDMALWLEVHPTNVELRPEHWDLVNETFSIMLKESDAFVSREANSSIKRLGVILFRIAMTLSAIRKYQNRDTTENIICHEDDFLAAIRITEVLRTHSQRLFDKLPKDSGVQFNPLSNYKKAFFDALPEEFTRKEAWEVANNFQLSQRSVTNYLNMFVEKGYLHRLKHGNYKKR